LSISAAGFRRGGEETIPGRSRATIEEDAMNPNFNWAIVAEPMQSRQAEAATAARARQAAGIRRATAGASQARRSRRRLAFAAAGSGR
jgi:hypothetical protein